MDSCPLVVHALDIDWYLVSAPNWTQTHTRRAKPPTMLPGQRVGAGLRVARSETCDSVAPPWCAAHSRQAGGTPLGAK
eukprot:4989502-Pyramimonas_sp.AAC.1